MSPILTLGVFTALTLLGHPVGASTNSSFSLCLITNQKFPGKVTFSDDSEYQDSQKHYYTAQERQLVPKCVFRPESTQDVADFVKLAAAHDPCSENCTVSEPLFAMRSGGHSLWAGAANVQGGLTVDLRSLDMVALSDDMRVASVGGGSVFSSVYPQLELYNVTVLGGRVPGVAAGGFLSGGGKSYLARRHGFSCDHIFGYEVVLASGEVVYASAGENSDLWLALKGGSSNFGIITRYDLETFPSSMVWGGFNVLNYTSDVLQAQASAFSNFMLPENYPNGTIDTDVGVILAYDTGSYFVLNTIFDSNPVPDSPTLSNFTSINGIESENLAISSIADLVVADAAVVPESVNRTFQLIYTLHNSDAELYYELMQIWEDGMSTIQSINGLRSQYFLQPAPVTNGTNVLGLDPECTDLVLSALTINWDDEADDTVMTEASESMGSKQEDVIRAAGVSVGFIYLNYADVSQQPISTYGEDNIAHLWDASRKYDPSGLWQTRVPGIKLPALDS
ncbi:hypothetical protein F5Y15DRAFT_416925 [Xylariaceae sp. FL0016]|nr:hypothetical protein F5Y15DRAFT_416925 [Xylariaceae sp. FL0016]